MTQLSKVTNGIQRIDTDLIAKTFLTNDLSRLNDTEKVEYIAQICHSLDLNPATRPIGLMKFNGKEVLYMFKDGTEQLRKLHKVSIEKIETKILEGGLYVVTAYAKTPDGRTDSSTGAIVIQGLKSDALANAMMKAETKAKRRVTLSICGLGFMDESEVESLPKESTYRRHRPTLSVNTIEPKKLESIDENAEMDLLDLKADIDDLEKSDSLQILQERYEKIYRHWVQKRNKEILKKIIDTKDKKKSELEKELKDFNAEIDEATGEIIGE